jgi:hypothetical protein
MTDTTTGAAPAAPFLDFRKVPAACGGVRDLADIALGETRTFRFTMGSDGEQACTVRAFRDALGAITVTAEPGEYEPVVEDGKLVGLCFPGCDRYPWQPYDPERDGPGDE